MKIAVVGYAGSGKTRAAKEFNKMGAELVDADEIGHRLLNKKEIKRKLVKTFGTHERKKLSKIVFNKNNIKKLNKIVHPYLIKELNRIKSKKITVFDAALYYELKLGSICDKIILVRTTKKNILKRAKNKDKIKKIIKLQKMPKTADFIIDNNKSFKETKKTIAKIWGEIR